MSPAEDRNVDQYPSPSPFKGNTTLFWCAECREQRVSIEGDICSACVVEKERGYRAMIKTGRCANGSELDHGRIAHAVKFGSNKALCGTQPGRRSVGWSYPYPRDHVAITCPKCLKKLDRIAQDNPAIEKGILP
jgi:hypothetical protein